MSIRLGADLTQEAVTRLLSELLPATIDLAAPGGEPGRRWIRFDQPHKVELVDGVGLRVLTSATVQWTAIGLAVPATLREVELLLIPLVVADERGPKLVFSPRIEKADFKLLPSFVDDAIAARINAALAAEGDLLGWYFAESLAHTVPMPANLAPVDAFHLGAGEMTVEVQGGRLTLILEVTARFSRQRDEP